MTAARHEVVIFTDGACSGNPGPGGWGAILVSGHHRKEISGGEALTPYTDEEERHLQPFADAEEKVDPGDPGAGKSGGPESNPSAETRFGRGVSVAGR